MEKELDRENKKRKFILVYQMLKKESFEEEKLKKSTNIQYQKIIIDENLSVESQYIPRIFCLKRDQNWICRICKNNKQPRKGGAKCCYNNANGLGIDP